MFSRDFKYYKCDKNINMEIETLKTKPPLRKNNRSLNATLLTFDLPTLIEKLKHSYTWAKGELNAMILLKRPDKQIVLTALHEETEIISFQSNDSITFQIIEGKLRFHTRKESITLDKGQLLTLHEKIKYSLTTWEETVLLLTIANRTFQPAEN
jgi:quercetin dioxygenase-like cupin family protein